MKTSRILKRISALACVPLAGIALQFTGCNAPSPTTAVKTMPPLPSSYILPSSIGKFDAGQIHNAELFYFFTHYDTVKYASYPNKFSQAAVDSLAALFISDSLQTGSGALSLGEISLAEYVFDSTFNACLSATPTHSQLVASVYTDEAHGLLASDEGNFIINADTTLRLCTTFTQTNVLISSLKSQYDTTTWASSTSHGVLAYEYLSIADSSCHLWGGPSGNGGSGDPGGNPPVTADAGAYVTAYGEYENEKAAMGWTEDQVIANAEEASLSASGAVGTTGGSYPAGGGGGWVVVTLFVLGAFLLVFA